MKYYDFKSKVQNYPFFWSSIFPIITENPNILRNQIKSWCEKGLIIPLKRGMYTLSDLERNVGLSGMVLANNLYMPSYLSLEYALSHYSLIPEAVYEWTSITTRKTNFFQTQFGKFTYSSIKIKAFTGFSCRRDEYDYPYFIAEAEKALLDFFYFRIPTETKYEPDLFEESYRFQNMEKISLKKLTKYLPLYRSKKVDVIVKLWKEVYT